MVVSGALFLAFKGLPGLPLPDTGIFLDLMLSLILIFLISPRYSDGYGVFKKENNDVVFEVFAN